MVERFNVHREVRCVLDTEEESALRVLPALAGEILASGDGVAITELTDALSMWVLDQHRNHRVAEAVLAMVRTHAIGSGAHYRH